MHTAKAKGSSFKKSVKATIGRALFALGLHRRMLQGKAVVVAFHRVSELALQSSINCPPVVFAELCRFFKRHFDVVTLAEFLDRLGSGRDIGGTLVITFDDGYKDNYEVAVPILRSLSLPATFFIATNFIGSRTETFWDKADGVGSEWMSWNEVQSLLDMGFDIGGHTMNHANLAAIPLDEAEREILGCRQMLTDKLRTTATHFAYPFGGEDNISEATRQMVKELGFKCCFSCHGGLVSRTDDAYDLRREPINGWVESPYQYGFELLTRASEGVS